MKKFLFATTAIVAAGVIATDAKANEPITLSMSGYMEQWIGYAGNEDDIVEASNLNPGELHASSDAEIHFSGSTTLDNGITFKAVIELEGNSATDQIDESSMTISGNFGSVILGTNDGAADSLFANGPSVGALGYDDGDQGDWLQTPANNGTGVPDTFRAITGDNKKVTYMSPKMSGFQLGASFTPQQNFEDGNGVGDQNANVHNIVSLGLAYGGDFDGVSVDFGAGYEFGSGANNNTDSDVDTWGLGGSVTFGNITVGGAYGVRETEQGTGAQDLEETSYSVGVAYSMGDAAVSLGYAHGENDNGTVTDESTVYDLGASYALGAGVDWKASLSFVDFDSDDPLNTGTATGQYEGTSWALVTGFALDF